LRIYIVYSVLVLVVIHRSVTTSQYSRAEHHTVLIPLPYSLRHFNLKISTMSKDLVLITGVNGYIAAVAAKHFLDHGHSVRGTVRKVASAKELLEGPLKEYADSGKFTVVEVPDITVDGAFDEAVKGKYTNRRAKAVQRRNNVNHTRQA
jgi:hypothetical protein